MTSVLKKLPVLLGTCSLLAPSLLAAANTFPSGKLNRLGLEQLMFLKVETVSRKAKSLSETPAAAFVITGEDIQRHGITSLPEALRLAPGVEVGQISPGKWSVTIRGFGGRFAGKLLVLIDGRSIYTPTFSGVYWEMHAPLLEEIERIEVIRGPGATLWGSNAMNGVINIITRKSSDKESQGGHFSATGGNQQQSLSARWGDVLGEHGHYRVYSKAERQNSFKSESGLDLENGFERYQLGMRGDWQKGKDTWMMTTETSYMTGGETQAVPDMSNLSLKSVLYGDTEVNNHHILGSWTRDLGNDSEIKVQAYIDYFDRTSPEYDEARTTANIDFQHSFKLGKRHSILWGAAYRYTKADFTVSDLILLNSNSPALNIVSAFVQDDIELVEDRLRLTAGIKAEDSEFSDLEMQPNLRLLWTPSKKHSLWASVSRAVRLPSIADHEIIQGDLSSGYYPMPALGGITLPLLVRVTSNPEFEPEEVITYELGYRSAFNDKLSFDLSLYYNEYEQLRDIGALSLEPAANYFILNTYVYNSVSGTTKGAELALDWRPNEQWRWQLSYNHMRINLSSSLPADLAINPGFDAGYENSSPSNQLSLSSHWTAENKKWNASIWLRAVDKAPLAGFLAGYSGGVESYVTMDARLAWQAQKDLELVLIGKNLLRSGHKEAIDDIYPLPSYIPRSVIAGVNWKF